MLGLGASLLKGGGIVLAYIKDSLKLFYPFTDNSPDFLLDGSTSFDGNDYIDLGDKSDWDMGSGDFTVGLYIKTSTNYSGGYGRILMYGEGGQSDDLSYSFFINTSNYLGFEIDDASTAKSATSSSAYNDGLWHHLVGVREGTNIKLYIDGSLITTTAIGSYGSLDMAGEKLYIGVNNDSGSGLNNYFTGDVANVGIWNRALSASEIESIRWRGAYSELKDTELTNLVSWYNLQGDVLDSAGSNNGTNNGATLNSNSYSGESPFKPRVRDLANPKMAVQLADGSTSFDGNDFINAGTLSDAFKNVANMSVSVWVYPTHSADADDDYHSIVNQWDHNASTMSWGLWLKAPNNSTDAHIHWNDGSAVEDGSATVPVNEWSHIAVTKSGTTVKLYHNGSEVHSGTGSSTTGNHSEDLLIGVQSESSKVAFFNGKMANISLHTSALTQLQVQELMFTEKYAGLSADLKTNLVSFYDMGSDQLSGTELITNGNFNTDVSSWSSDNSGLITSQDNGVSGTKCLRIQKNGDTNPLAYQDFTTVVGQTYRITYYVKAGTEASSQVAMGETDYSNRTFSGVVETPTEWTQRTHDHIATATTSRLLLYLSNDSASGSETIFYDDVSVQKIEVPDSEGTNDGNVFGAITTTGYTSSPHGVVDPLNFGEVYSGRSLYFGGATDYSIIGDISATMYAMSFWFNSNSDISASSGLGHPICLTDDIGYGGIFFGGWTSSIANEMISIVGNSGGNRNYYASATDVILDDMWHHLGITWDSSNSKYKIYLDGVELSVASEGSMTPIVCDYVMLGRRYDDNHYYHGLLKTIKIFNTALTEAQLQELYTNPEQLLPTSVSASSLKLDLPMQEGSGDYIYDGSGNGNHGTLYGAGLSWQTGEKDGYQSSLVRSNTPMIFDGNNDYIDCGNGTALDITSNLSMSLWVKINDGSSTQFLMGRDNDAQRNWELGISSNKLFFGIFSSNSNQGAGGLGNTLSDNVWYHIVATYDGSNQKTYVNGSLTSTTSGSGSIDNDNVSLTIGARPNGDRYFDGIINEVGLWNVALDADAVTALYNSGVPLLPTSDSGNYDNSSALQGYWRNDGNTTWTDRSTNSNNGTASGSPATIVIPEGSTSGRDNQGFLLSNTHQNSLRLYGNEYVEIQDSETLDLSPSSGFSVESWVYINSLDAYNPILSQWNTADNSVASWVLETVGSDLTFYIRDTSSGGSNKGAISSSTATPNVWIHVVGVFEGDGISNGLKIYVNGTVGGTTQTITTSQKASFNIMIGEFINKNNTWDGLIDESRIYSKALSASEVLKNYNSGKSSHS